MAGTTHVQTSSRGSNGLLLHAFIGAVVMLVLTIIPLSPVLGGAVAGYLHKSEGMKVGALAGLFAVVPVVAVIMFGVAFLTPFVTSSGGSTIFPSLGFLLIGLVSLLLVGLYTIGLGALGGYIAVTLTESRTTTPSA
ncbi:DUF5518 domain-containing protein [Haladaptatus sp. ZSTT2]|uniref:DUF5518 domain-containing protein n=1 Tax=Haladaptatus sp. ZSTT2 TaxID=3120515 RepID=UPI00300EA2FD